MTALYYTVKDDKYIGKIKEKSESSKYTWDEGWGRYKYDTKCYVYEITLASGETFVKYTEEDAHAVLGGSVGFQPVKRYFSISGVFRWF